MPRGHGRQVGKVGKRRRKRTLAQVVVWVAGAPVALAFLLLLARQSWPLAALVFLVLAGFAWWEWGKS
ncbi:MAG: hypothetical protein Q8R28_10915 [Dehalococcoidia bacterium]|nr:hypothetical protein [Dehalococcoidia bacterium]